MSLPNMKFASIGAKSMTLHGCPYGWSACLPLNYAHTQSVNPTGLRYFKRRVDFQLEAEIHQTRQTCPSICPSGVVRVLALADLISALLAAHLYSSVGTQPCYNAGQARSPSPLLRISPTML
jgi:hypothetical protein